MLYIVDTCSFTALKRVYPRDVFPSVWESVDGLIRDGKFRSIELVLDELMAGEDEVVEWAKLRKYMFRELDEHTQHLATQILSDHPTILDLKRRRSSADPFVIAHAELHGATVVTEEKPSGGPEKQKIPDVCRCRNVRCLTLLETLRLEGHQF